MPAQPRRRTRVLLVAATCWVVAAAIPAVHADGTPGHAALLQSAADDPESVFGRIEVRVLEVFDTDRPDEDNRVFRAANRLHIRTKEHVIRSQILFRTGDRFDPRLMEESERILRGNRYLAEAEIHPVDYHDGQVDVEVVTRDVWTLTATAGFSRSGGENEQRVEFQDTNVLGLGKDVTVQWTSTVDRDSLLMRYRDPLLAGSRFGLEAWYADNSDGYQRRLDLVRPFFSLGSRWAAGVRGLSEERVDQLYDRGGVIDKFGHRIDRAEVFGGRSAGLSDGHARRWSAGATFERHRFETTSDFKTGPLPPDRLLVYPWVGFEWIRDGFAVEQNLDQIARTEDLRLGLRLDGRLGMSTTALGADSDRLIFSSSLSRGFRPTEDNLLFLSVDGRGRYGSAGFEDLWLGAKARLYVRTLDRQQFVGRLSVDLVRNLDPEHQLLLGGDSGLRGYPLRYEEGTRRFLLTLEQRFYMRRQLFRLLHAGAAVFFDTGRAWDQTGKDPGMLSDVGVGLRLSPSRTGRGTMIHFDVAFPLNGDGSIDSMQWLVSARDAF